MRTRSPPGKRANLTNGFNAINPGQSNIHQDDRILLSGKAFDGFLSGLGERTGHPDSFKERSEYALVGRFILNNEHGSRDTERILRVRSALRPAPSVARANGVVSKKPGSFRRKVEPCPGTLSTEISPPNTSAKRRQMERPKPAPSCRRFIDISTCRKGSKILSRFSGEIPGPVSIISN